MSFLLVDKVRYMGVLTIKPGKVYLLCGACSILVGVLFWWGLGQAKPSDNPEMDLMLIILFCSVYVVADLLLFAYCGATRICVSDDGITVKKLFGPTMEYSWGDVTHARVAVEAYAFPCEVYSRECRIAKVPRAFAGYENLLEVLAGRGLLEEGAALDRTRRILEIDGRRPQAK